MGYKVKAETEALREDLPHILSLGGGVQSSTLGFMAAKGLVKPMPVAAIFADVKAEPAGVYRWLDWLEKQLPFPVYRVTWRDGLVAQSNRLRTTIKEGRTYWNSKIPFHTVSEHGHHGMLFRKCTADFKLGPLMRKAKEIAGMKRGAKTPQFIQWIGISSDELTRMKISPWKYATNRWPLAELGMTRADCLDWMKAEGYPEPPRSACYFCPYHSNKEWARLQKEEPAEFEKAAEFEKQQQTLAAQDEVLRDVPYLHPSCKLIGDIDFENLDPDQFKFSFLDECEGMCGN